MVDHGDENIEIFEAMRKYTRPTDFVDLGTSTFNFGKSYAKIKEMGHVKYTLVENESISEDKFKSVANDLQVLRKYI
jgi:hypothetical protein